MNGEDPDARKGSRVNERLWTVTALISEVNSLLEEGFSGIRVEGELTNVSNSARGHVYFSLKDDSATIDCVMWSSRARRLKFELEAGLEALGPDARDAAAGLAKRLRLRAGGLGPERGMGYLVAAPCRGLAG